MTLVNTNKMMTENVDIVKFLQQMQVKISEDIKNSNETLRKEIYEGRKEMREELNAMNKKIDETKVESKQTGLEVRKHRNETDARFKKIEERMDTLDTKAASHPLKNKHVKDVDIIAVESKEETYKDKLVNNAEKTPEFKSTWARQVSQMSLESQLKKATEDAAAVEAGDRIKHSEKGAKKPVKMGDSGDLHGQMDWPWDESEREWDGMEDKVERNKEKRRRAREKRIKNVEKAAKVGRCTIGVGPIKNDSIDYFNKITGDYDEAKKLAAAEYLEGYLEFDHEDMSDMNITDTKISGKKDEIMYIVFDSPTKVINVRRRIADLQNEDIKTREFVPPQFFKRYNALSKHAADVRKGNREIKTQIRFTADDICLYTKVKGTEGPLEPVDMEALEKEIDLPAIEHNIKWSRKPDRPEWRQSAPQKKTVELRSLCKGSPGMSREKQSGSVTSLDGAPRHKKQKVNSADSSDSSPGSSLDTGARKNGMDCSN